MIQTQHIKEIFFLLNKYLYDLFFFNPTKNSRLRVIFQYFKNTCWYLEVIALYMWVIFHSDALLKGHFIIFYLLHFNVYKQRSSFLAVF